MHEEILTVKHHFRVHWLQFKTVWFIVDTDPYVSAARHTLNTSRAPEHSASATHIYMKIHLSHMPSLILGPNMITAS